VTDAVESRRLPDLGVEETAVDRALAAGCPVIEEVERRPDVIVLVHCTPLLVAGTVTGAMVLLRDVTDLRRLDRCCCPRTPPSARCTTGQNNLQTISSLCASRPVAWLPVRDRRRCAKRRGGSAPSPSSTRSCRANRATRCRSTRS